MLFLLVRASPAGYRPRPMWRGLLCVFVLAVIVPVATGGCGEPDDPRLGEDGVSNVSFCDPVALWDDEWVELEWQALELLNAERSAGATCGDQAFPPAEPLAMEPALRCAARFHSLDMSMARYFDHINRQGEQPADRFGRAGYNPAEAGENIAWGQPSAKDAVRQWMADRIDCATIMSPDFVHVGIGYYPDAGPYWTNAVGAPR